MKVLAGVVTYNRLSLLKECIASLRVQTCQDLDILIVNNNSTDGTREYLDNEQSLSVIHQDNLGGAGGFYACQKYAVENGYDYVWLMDDDGLAAPNQLELLLDGAKKYQLDWANALVVNKEDHSKVCNGMTIEEYCDFWGSREVIPHANPFNGTLLSCEAIKKIGYIKKEMYIWGDESEYYRRFQSKGYKLATIVAAIHYHPKFKAYDDYVFPFIKRDQ